MSSIIEGYNYDIFISYRQKDNKGDRWVSDFVEALKTELESTFKEEISVYFDINPHDGLLETHDVDASLKEKLKCLIFIPVISRTYCDPKSFAWEHEFKAFVEQASKDQYGLKVKLPNGNVANRVLPILIHDLDPDDISMCEAILGGFLRGIEFIYKEPGVNRPLKPDDDEKINLNKTKYRNQVNKTANAIKEVIRGLVDPHAGTPDERTKIVKTGPGYLDKTRRKTAVAVIITAAILIAGVLILPPVIKKMSAGLPERGKSIAVLPFINLSNDPAQEYFTIGLVDDILDRLCKVGGLDVRSHTSSMRYKDTNLSIKEIAGELGVNTIMEGSVRKEGNNVRITVKLIDAKKDAHLWSNSYESKISDIFSIQSEVAQAVARELKAVVTPETRLLIEKRPTKNMEAYEAYQKGVFYHSRLNKNDLETALKYFELAIEKDPEFALAYAGICRVWRGREQMGITSSSEATPQAEAAVMKALELDTTYSEIYHALGGLMTWSKWDWKAGEAAFRKAIELNPKNADAHSAFSHLLMILGRNYEAMKHIEAAVELDPFNPKIQSFYGGVLLSVNRYEDAIKAYQKALDLNPTQGVAGNIINALILAGREKEAVEMQKYRWKDDPELLKAFEDGYAEAGWPGANRKVGDLYTKRAETSFVAPGLIAHCYDQAGDIDKAIYWLERAYKEHSPNLPYAFGPKSYLILKDNPRYQELARQMNLPFKPGQ
ncbi:MAG: hypothetical protein H6Q24_1495 [Bacteroidetes bacterium]|nr:hypothetical protein [Bacteroidota bacterium]